jgi:hypothetical protein
MMLATLRSHLTYSNVMATIAVFVALGGSGYAAAKLNGQNIKDRSISGKKLKKRTISREKVKKDTLTGTEIEEAKLGTVPRATRADSAADAASLGGTPASAYASLLATDEAPHVVGAAGEPTIDNGGQGDCLWQGETAGGDVNPVSFYRGKDGRVHLAGWPAAQNGPGGCGPELEDARIFTLPAGYRPAHIEQFTSSTDNGAVSVRVVIGADHEATLEGVGTIPAGAVMTSVPRDHPQGVTLDGIDFRAAGTGGF